MKKIVTKASVIFALCAAFLVLAPMQAEAQVSAEAARALREARISVFEQRTDPSEFTLPFLNGGNAALSAYRGKVVILNFWATWCPPCRTEMPSMEVLYQQFKSQGLEILAVDMEEDVLIVGRFVRSNGYTFPVMLDRDGRVSGMYGIRAIPTTYILDREGKIIGRIVGSILWNDPRVIAAIDALLKS